MEIIQCLKGEKYLLYILERHSTYRTFYMQWCRALNRIKDTLGIAELTTYWARHSWATIASSLDIPKDTISHGLGHRGNTVTDIYIYRQKTVKPTLEKADKTNYATALNSDIESNITSLSSTKDYEKIMGNIIKAVQSKSYSDIKSCFTTDGWNMMDKLLHYGNAKMMPNQTCSYFPIKDGEVRCRRLKMTFSFPNNHKTFTEDVTFAFDKDKKIECVAFALGHEAKEDILDKTVWTEDARMQIVTFLENYKTAFALKRLDYIESIFDDNAVIITGHVTKPKTNLSRQDGNYHFNNSEVVTYNRYTKSQYIDKLRKIFANNQFVNIHFSNNDVCKMPGAGECYGIQVHQDYYSSSYGDTGYLFLMLDLNNPDEPLILVRTWQPERDPNYNTTPLPRNHPDYGIVSPANF